MPGYSGKEEDHLTGCNRPVIRIVHSKRDTAEHIRSDNGPEFTAKAVRYWLERLGVKTLFIEPGSPWENGYIESFNGKLRDELLNREIFTTLTEAKILTEQWVGSTIRYALIVLWNINRQLLRLS